MIEQAPELSDADGALLDAIWGRVDAPVARAFDPSQARDETGKWTSGGGKAHPVSGIESFDRGASETHAQHAARLAGGIVATKKRMGVLYRQLGHPEKYPMTPEERAATQAEYDNLLWHRKQLVKFAAAAEKAAAAEVPAPAPTRPTSDHVGPLVTAAPAPATGYGDALAKWAGGLTPTESEAIKHWTGTSSYVRKYEAHQILPNSGSTFGYAPETIKTATEALRSAIAKAPEYVGTVYRGLGELPPEVAKSYTTPGNVLTLEATASFSKSQTVAMDFGSNYVLVMSGHTGGVDIHKAGLGFRHEKEVVLPKGIPMRVAKVEDHGGNKWIHLERAN